MQQLQCREIFICRQHLSELRVEHTVTIWGCTMLSVCCWQILCSRSIFMRFLWGRSVYECAFFGSHYRIDYDRATMSVVWTVSSGYSPDPMLAQHEQSRGLHVL